MERSGHMSKKRQALGSQPKMSGEGGHTSSWSGWSSHAKGRGTAAQESGPARAQGEAPWDPGLKAAPYPSSPLTILCPPHPRVPRNSLSFASVSSIPASLLSGVGHAGLCLQPGLYRIHISMVHLPIHPSL